MLCGFVSLSLSLSPSLPPSLPPCLPVSGPAAGTGYVQFPGFDCSLRSKRIEIAWCFATSEVDAAAPTLRMHGVCTRFAGQTKGRDLPRCQRLCEDSQEAQFNLPIASDEKTIPYLATDRRPKRKLNQC